MFSKDNIIWTSAVSVEGKSRGDFSDVWAAETLADGNWLVKQNQPVSKIETNLTQSRGDCMSLDSGMH
jgi:hypothetical protein